jgi:hypothetical protein
LIAPHVVIHRQSDVVTRHGFGSGHCAHKSHVHL